MAIYRRCYSEWNKKFKNWKKKCNGKRYSLILQSPLTDVTACAHAVNAETFCFPKLDVHLP